MLSSDVIQGDGYFLQSLRLDWEWRMAFLV
jgi:hypothetical protein